MAFLSSIPSSSRTSAGGWTCIHGSSLGVAGCGQLNCPFSRRLLNMQMPVPSNQTALSSVRGRLVKKYAAVAAASNPFSLMLTL